MMLSEFRELTMGWLSTLDTMGGLYRSKLNCSNCVLFWIGFKLEKLSLKKMD